MIGLLNVEEHILYPSSIPCTWDSSFNSMTMANHKQNQLLDYILIHKDHTLNNSVWFNFIIDAMAPEQWHLLGANQMFYNTRNIPLMELSDHYPVFGFFNLNEHQWPEKPSVFGFFNLNEHQWPEKPSGTLTYVRIEIRQMIVSLFILTNNGTPRRHRCLKSEQFIILIDGDTQEFYLSDAKFLRMKYEMEQVNRYLNIIQKDNKTKCIQTDSTFILETLLSTGIHYIKQTSSYLCSYTIDRDQAQIFRLIEVERKNINCIITH
ncbi:unnamed protein product [Rotaria socialis]|uniref:Endonuclease/exonuclease/phosphatase domain-containing protein n=1 Tax=Rotaria socialis TaxID=392032 RepID=A0A820L498_9BILA|nr:unnamed protein product [Rotaria socialis]